MNTAVGNVAIYVADLARSERFYVRTARPSVSTMEPTRLEPFRVTIAMITDLDGYVVELGQIEPR